MDKHLCFSSHSSARLQSETLVSLSQPLHKYVFSWPLCFEKRLCNCMLVRTAWQTAQIFQSSSSLNLISLLLLLSSSAQLFVPSLQLSDWCWHIPLKMWKIFNWTGKELTPSSVCRVAIQRGILSYLKPQGNIIVHVDAPSDDWQRTIQGTCC